MALRSCGWALTLAALAFPQSSLACAACFGRSDSKMAEGMNMGILSLLLIVLAVLGGIAAFFVYLMVRSARLAAAARGSAQMPATPAQSTH